jgi:transposase-like protein
MGRSRHTEAQIIAALKQVEAGRTVDDVARECGVSQATIYTWMQKITLGVRVAELADSPKARCWRSLTPSSKRPNGTCESQSSHPQWQCHRWLKTTFRHRRNPDCLTASGELDGRLVPA